MAAFPAASRGRRPPSVLRGPPHYSHQGRIQVEGHLLHKKNIPEADGDSQTGRQAPSSPTHAPFTAHDPKTRRVRGQAVGGRVRAVDARTETILPIGTPTPKTRRNGHGRYHPLVPTFYPAPHLRPHLRPEAQPAGRSWSQGLTCQRCSWAGRVGAGPLYKRPTVSLAGQLSPGDFGKKWGTPSSHLACQEPAWPTEGSWTLRGPDQLHTQHNWGD